HPRWRELLAPPAPPAKKRVNLLALGDVGSTLLLALRLLGEDQIASIGILDPDERVTARWATELEQIAYPWDYDRLPPVEAVGPDALFDCDLFVFCASKGIPPVGSDVRDVRMAQLEGNAAILAPYARMARERRFSGLFAVVSDPVDPLCKVALVESNRGPDGKFDGLGLFPEQIQGYGLGVMNARAAYFAKRDPRFASFLTEGRSFGPHGEDLVIANSIARYDDALSRELTGLTVGANLQIRALGFKPYVAPALSSGALSLLLSLRGEWHCGSVFLGGVYLGVKNRFTPAGLETESLALPDPLFARIQTAADRLADIL
ncbi:MAG: lactate dehydrogenase, partial [Oscillospiraceae bacterium]